MQHAQDEPVLAAAAEEMSGQVQDLQQLIGFFKFDGSAARLAVAKTFHTAPRRPAVASARKALSLCGAKAPDGPTPFRGDATDLAKERPC
jgi:hypothetical protein